MAALGAPREYPCSPSAPTRICSSGRSAGTLHAIVHQPLSIFDANIFYPLAHTLAYSENAIGSALLAAPVLAVSGNPVLALNAVLLLACVLCGVGTFVLARRLGVSLGGSVIAGLIFAFSPPRFLRTGQLHLATIQWLPFCLASLHMFLKTGRARHAWWACGFLGIELLTSGHGTIFILLASLSLIAWHAAFGETRLTGKMLEQAALPAVLVAALAAAVFCRIARPSSTWACSARSPTRFDSRQTRQASSPLPRTCIGRFSRGSPTRT